MTFSDHILSTDAARPLLESLGGADLVGALGMQVDLHFSASPHLEATAVASSGVEPPLLLVVIVLV